VRQKKICIVTPDLTGPVKNGGIGTHVYNLALLLASQNQFSVTILFTGKVRIESSRYWQEQYSHLGITFCALDDYSLSINGFMFEDWFLQKSMKVLHFLGDKKFDFIHFQDWQANAFSSIQALQTTNIFDSSLITVTMHSPTEWIDQGMNQWSRTPDRDSKLQWCERYCCEHAPILISPSNYLFSWAEQNWWTLAESRFVLPYCLQRPKHSCGGDFDPLHLIFFGRLEKRKGLDLFCESLRGAIGGGIHISKVSFIGKHGIVGEETSKHYIQRTLNECGITFVIEDNFDTFQAQEYLNKHNGIVVIPSQKDNLPFAAIESAVNGAMVLATNVGGIPEIIDREYLFEPTPASLLAKIRAIQNNELPLPQHPYSIDRAAEGWLQFHTMKAQPVVIRKGPESGTTLIDLTANETSVNAPAWINNKAQEAGSENLVIANSARYSRDDLLQSVEHAFCRSGADIVLCHFYCDEVGAQEPEEFQLPTTRIRQPIGPCLECSGFEQVFGAGMLALKREVFLSVGKFNETYESLYVEEFCIRAAIAGCNFAVIPTPLITLRNSDLESDPWHNLRTLAPAISSHFPPHLKHFYQTIFASSFSGFYRVLGKLREEMSQNISQKEGSR